MSIKDGFIASLTAPIYGNYYSSIPIVNSYKYVESWLSLKEQKSILILKYEDYTEDPIRYIKKIIKFLDLNNIKAKDIEFALNSKRIESLKNSYYINRYLPGRSKSTFREGKVNGWKIFFDEEINQIFHKYLPDDLDKIL